MASFSLRALALVAMLVPPAHAQLSHTPAARLVNGGALAEALGVGDFSLQTLALEPTADGGLRTTLMLDGNARTLVLQPHSMRSPQHFAVRAQVQDGSWVEHEAAPSRTWRGHVLGEPGSAVAASLSDGSLTGAIRLGASGAVWGIHPARDLDPSRTTAEHFVYSAADALQRGESCGGAVDIGLIDPGPAAGAPSYAGTSLVTCEVACDADVEFYNKNGHSVTTTELDIESVLNVVETIYEADVGITYAITTILVRTAEPDPYSGTAPSSLLNQFRSEWNNNQGAIHRDVAHLFTGRDIDGGVIGIAWLSVICSGNQGYGLSQSKFAGAMTSRAALTAHEIGHNWSANHCDGQPNCRIMCSGLGGCTGVITSFGPDSIASITNKKNAVGCLDVAAPPPAPTLASISPATVAALGGTVVTLTGDDFFEATELHVGSQVLLPGSGFNLTNDISLTFVAPLADGLGDLPVTLVGPGGSSATLPLTVVVTDPVQLLAPTLISTPTDTSATWTVAGSPSATVYFLFDIDAGVFNYKGFPVLATPFPVLSIAVNAAGIGQFVAPIDPSLGGVGLYTLFSQVVLFDPAVDAVSSVKGSLVF